LIFGGEAIMILGIDRGRSLFIFGEEAIVLLRVEGAITG